MRTALLSDNRGNAYVLQVTLSGRWCVERFSVPYDYG
jgi:hypothetical protein